MPSLLPTVSVVIPTKNGGPTFVTLLSALRKQVHYADMEIRVVDSGSGDGTPEQAKEFGAEVLSIDPRTFNHGATRNLGIRESRGELIAMFTQDALPLGETYMLTLVESLQAAQAAGAYARQIPRPDASRLVRRDLESWIGSSPDKRIVKMESGCRFFALPPIERYRTCVFDNVAGLIRRRVWETFPIPPVPFGRHIVHPSGGQSKREPRMPLSSLSRSRPLVLSRRRIRDEAEEVRLFASRSCWGI